jgi:hypothetical protein
MKSQGRHTDMNLRPGKVTVSHNENRLEESVLELINNRILLDRVLIDTHRIQLEEMTAAKER